MEVYFDNINVSQQIFQGNILDESSVEVSYILIQDFQPVQVYEQRVVMMKGKIKQSVFGHFDQPVGYVAFSIENETDDQIIQIVGPEQKISYETFGDPHDSTAVEKYTHLLLVHLETKSHKPHQPVEYLTVIYIVRRHISIMNKIRLVVFLN